MKNKTPTTPPSAAKTMRLNKFISHAGICSRREADTLIQAGHITVNGQQVTTLGYQVTPRDVVKYRNKPLSAERLQYVLLNKPKNCITTAKDPQDRRTVLHLTRNACPERIYPVGRLDRNTTGLLLLTNDGALATKLSHPASKVKKLYHVTLDRPLASKDFDQLQAGVQLEDGIAHIDELAIATQDRTSVGLVIHMGRNRIIRRLFEHLNYAVEKLDRVMYAHLTKKDLPRGQWRLLTASEVQRLKHLC